MKVKLFLKEKKKKYLKDFTELIKQEVERITDMV
jgi:hypothetical protein